MSRSTRESMAERIARVGTATAEALAEFATRKGDEGELPCWGAIAEHIKDSDPDDATFASLWQAMVQMGDPRPQLVLLSTIRGNSKRIERAAADAANVSPVVRQAFRALQDPNDTESNRGFDTRVRELLAVRYFAADSVEPEHESERRSR